MNESENFSERLKRWRARLSVAQPEAAKLLDIGRTYYSELENGREPGKFLKSKFELLEHEDVDRVKVRLALTLHDEAQASYGSDPRAMLRNAREAKGWTEDDLAEISHVPAQYIRDVEAGNLRGGNEKQLRKLAKALDLSPDALMSGSDYPRIIDESGRRGTFGAIPPINLPGRQVRFVPLLSWAQAGALDSGFVDEAYDYSGAISIDLNDKRAFGLTIRGDSMVPEIREGDDAIVCPTWQPRNGDTVIARTQDGDVMCKIYQTKEGGQKVVLSSYNPAHPPIELSREEIAWIYPVGQVVRNYRKQ